MDKVIALTGASGFIGNNFLNLIDTFNFKKIKLLSRKNYLSEKYDVYKSNLLSDPVPDDFVKDSDILIHFAALAHDTNNIFSKKDIVKINYDKTIQIIEKSLIFGVKKFVYISSVKIYQPDTIYAKLKLKIEKYIQNLPNNSKTKFIIIRPSLVYGSEAKGNLALMLKMIKYGIFPNMPFLNNNKYMIHINDLSRLIKYLIIDYKLLNKVILVDAAEETKYSTYDIYKIMVRHISKKQFFTINEKIFLFLKNLFRMKIFNKISESDNFILIPLSKIAFHTQKNLNDYFNN